MANKKQLAAVVGAIALTAVVAVGGTLAYLSSVTETAKNKFTSSKGVEGELVEDEWKYGDEGWKDYLPGDVAKKDPRIQVKGGVDVYTGMKVECIDANGKAIAFDEFQKLYATVFTGDIAGVDTANWTKVEGKDFYIYKGSYTAAAGKEGLFTAPLFDSVQVNAGIVKVYDNKTANKTVKVYKVDENGNKVDGGTIVSDETILIESTQQAYIVDAQGNETLISNEAGLPSFEINVTGYAIQEQGNEGNYQNELLKLAGYTI